MRKLTVQIENCYGIGRLDCEFDFTNSNVYSVYAPNGSMKTSFLQVFMDVGTGATSHDRHFPERTPMVDIRDESGTALTAECVYAVPPLEGAFKTEPSSLLLVNAEAKRRYDEALRQIQSHEMELSKRLKQASRLKSKSRTPEAEMCGCFDWKGDYLDLLESLRAKVNEPVDERLLELDYSRLFSDDAIPLLRSGELNEQLEEYIKTFNTLVDESPILNRSFNHFHASSVRKSLDDNGFFKANHAVRLNDGGSGQEIGSVEEYDKTFQAERARVLSDDGLAKRFDAIEKKLSRQGLRDLRDYLAVNQDVIARLLNYSQLQRDMWISILASDFEAYEQCVDAYGRGKKAMRDAVTQAENERTDWEVVVEQFNRWFKVPFDVSVENTADVILKDTTPKVAFTFRDCDGECPVDEAKLQQSLSLGEKRALYLLNILFEIRVRSRAAHDTLLIFDDVADSFDYRNKYAIIEYLNDVRKNPKFRLVALTHNFDFHRTLCSRMGVKTPQRLYVVRDGRTIEFSEDPYWKPTPFHHWRGNLNTPEIIVASIPFVRNLAEYCGCKADCKSLTSLVHIKSDTSEITVDDLQAIYSSVLRDEPRIENADGDARVVDMIFDTADKLLEKTGEDANLEDKIVLSIATRLAAEQYMIRRIDNPDFVDGLKVNQTQQLTKRYKLLFEDSDMISLIDRVSLITPEGIHVNAFMYEPILDMSPTELRSLYADVKTLLAPV